jgi:hypothetical protein
MDKEDLKEKAKKSWNYAREIHTIENYKKNMYSILNSIFSHD